MPKTPINYSKTIIYRIVCKDPTIKECYVGSTTDFKNRKRHHKSTCNTKKYRQYNINVYQFIRNNGGWQNWDMIEVEKYNATDKLSQYKRERYWLEYYNATLNSQIPSRTGTEYGKKYREENREHIQKYREENREDQKEYFKERYIQNKDKLKETRSEKITCECGAISSKCNLTRHKKSKKHLAFTGNAINVSNTTGNMLEILEIYKLTTKVKQNIGR